MRTVLRRTVLVICALALSTPASRVAACAFEFEHLAPVLVPAPAPETRLHVADLDGDGLSDVVVTVARCPGEVHVLRGSAGGLLPWQVLTAADGVTGIPSGAASADFDLDGDVDLAIGHLEASCAGAGRGVTVFHQLPSGTFGDADAYAGDGDGRLVLATDLDGSGLPLIITGDGPPGLNATTGKSVQIRLNEGPDDFHHVHEFGIMPGSHVPDLIHVGRVDALGTADILVGWRGGRFASYLCNFGDGTFEEWESTALSPVSAGAAVGMDAGDVDGNGIADLVVSHATEGRLVVHRGGAFGGCGSPGIGETWSTITGITQHVLVDLDGDAELDLAGAAGVHGSLALHGGTGDGAFGPVREHAMEGAPFRVAHGNFGGDGLTDLVVLLEDGRLVVLVNRSTRDGCPIARTITPVTFTADSGCDAVALLDGSRSLDPEGAPLTYLWYLDGVLVLETAEPIAEWPAGLGTFMFVLVVRDPSGFESRPASLTVRVLDRSAPVLVAEPPPPAECSSPSGNVLTVSASATDECPGVVLSSNFGPGGSVTQNFRRGVTTVQWTARDGAGNTVVRQVAVHVQDTTPPLLACPSVLRLPCGGPCGATASVVASASDACSTAAELSVSNDRTCTPLDASGEYPVGETLVRFDASDPLGNAASCTTRVIVEDLQGPQLALPPAVVRVECTGDGQGVATVVASAEDACSSVASLANDRTGGADASGPYPLGLTPLAWTATDALGNSSSGATAVEVVDTTPPLLDCGSPVRVSCSSGTGARVTLRAHAADACDPAVAVTNDHSPGGAEVVADFPVGATTVTFDALDGSGNAATCAVTVTVEDLEAPELACPAEIRAECAGGGGADVPVRADASDCCGGSVVTNDRTGAGGDASGFYPVGETLVTFDAEDAAGNAATCTTRVIVSDTRPPVLACADRVDAECAGGGGAAVDVRAFVSDGCDAAPDVVNDRTGGGADARGTYPVGETLVTFTAEDESGLAATCVTRVVVADTTPPLLACPAQVVAECASPSGTPATVLALAADACDAALVVTNDRTGAGPDASGTFPFGSTSVRFDAVDDAGHAVSCTTVVDVVDTQPPLVAASADVQCLWPPNHQLVRFRLGEHLFVSVQDACAGTGGAAVAITGATSSEPEDGPGDGSSAPDVVLVGDDEILLRSERSGGAPGRVYTIAIEVADPAGNVTTVPVIVRVPHGNGPPEGCRTLPRDRFVSDREAGF